MKNNLTETLATNRITYHLQKRHPFTVWVVLDNHDIAINGEFIYFTEF